MGRLDRLFRRCADRQGSAGDRVGRYRKLRNTFRYLLGALDGFTDEEAVAVEAMPELERYVLHRLGMIDTELRTRRRVRVQPLYPVADRLRQ